MEKPLSYVVSFPIDHTSLLNPETKLLIGQAVFDKLQKVTQDNDLELKVYAKDTKPDELYTLQQLHTDFESSIPNNKKLNVLSFDPITKRNEISYNELISSTKYVVEKEGLFLDNKGVMWQRSNGVMQEFELELNRIVGLYYVEENYCKPHIKNQIIERIKQVAYEKYLKVDKFEHNRNYIYFLDKKINWKTGEVSKREKDEIVFIQLPHKVGKSIETPFLDKLLHTLSMGDVDKFKDMVIYQALPYNPEKAINWWLGEHDTGKSAFESVVTQFVGEENVCFASFKLLIDEKQRFESYKLRNKLVCFVSEIEKGVYSTNTLKRISGNDDLSGEKKGVNGGITIKSTVTLNILTNDLPDILNKEDEAFTTRCFIYDFKNQFERVLNAKQLNIPKEEYGNLCLYLITKIQEWVKLNKVILSGTTNIAERHNEYLKRADPLAFTVNSKFEYCEDQYVYTNDVFDAINEVLVSKGKKEQSFVDLGRKLKSTFKTLGWDCKRTQKQIDNKTHYIFSNIKHKPKVKNKSPPDSPPDKKQPFVDEKAPSPPDVTNIEKLFFSSISLINSSGFIWLTPYLKPLKVRPDVALRNYQGLKTSGGLSGGHHKNPPKRDEIINFVAQSNKFGVPISTMHREYGNNICLQLVNDGYIVGRNGNYFLALDSPKPEVTSE